MRHICIYKKQISTRKTNTQLKATSFHVLISTKIIHPRAIKSLLVQESCAAVLRLSQQRPKEMFRKFTTGMKRSFLTPYMHFFFFKYTALRISLTQSHRDTQNLPPPDPFSDLFLFELSEASISAKKNIGGKNDGDTFLAMAIVGLSMGVLLAISSSSLLSLRGIASFWCGDKLNFAAAQRMAATP